MLEKLWYNFLSIIFGIAFAIVGTVFLWAFAAALFVVAIVMIPFGVAGKMFEIFCK